jgi:uncharacterized membrane protein YfcA
MFIDLILYLGVGAIAGMLAGLLGVGGGLVIVPVLVWVFRSQGFDESIVMHLAVGSSLATIIATSLGSIRAHHSRGAVRWDIFRHITPGIVIGALLGAVIANLLDTLWLQRIFGAFVILTGLRMLLSTKVAGAQDLPTPTAVSGAGGVIGAMSALVGIGGGTLSVPYLCWHRIPMINAVATSSAIGLPIALSGTLGFLLVGWNNAALPSWSTGYLYWPAIGGVVLTSVMLTSVGAGLAHRLPVASIKRFFALLLLTVGLKLLIG